MNEFKLKYCELCGNVIKIMNGKGTENIVCCGVPMRDVVANSTEASREKHIPTYIRKEDKLEVRVSHVMEEEHSILWIAFVTENEEYIVYLNPFQEAVAQFPAKPSGTLYAYCNQHGLWKKEIESFFD